MTPGVIIKSTFVRPGAKASGGTSEIGYQDFLNYMAREKAKQMPGKKEKEEDVFRLMGEAEYGHFLEYMDNRAKTENLFTADKDELSTEDKRELQRLFRVAQSNGAIMWQNVISFDNEWLRENGAISEDGVLDRDTLMNAARASMQQLLKAEDLTGSAIWTAAIHYNTDNYHIHFAITEPYPCREHTIYNGQEEIKGYLKKGSLAKAKSAVVNSIMGRQIENEQINELIRNKIIAGARNRPANDDPILADMCGTLLKKLPDDRRLWKYNMNAIANERELIDAVTTRYLELYHADDYEKLTRLLDIQQEKYNRAYGNSKRDFADGRIRDLYTRMGNTVLKELSMMKEEKDLIRKTQLSVMTAQPDKPEPLYTRQISPLSDLRRLLRALDNEYTNRRELMEYDRMIEEIITESERLVTI